MTTAHAIPKKGKLHVGVSESWNEGALDSPVDYFSSITCNSFKVGGVERDPDSYVCSFFDGNRVEIEGGFKSDGAGANTKITINIVGFRNPILANVPFDVFTVFSTDEEWENTIDTKTASITVTKPAALTGGLFSVFKDESLPIENRGVVQEPNTM